MFFWLCRNDLIILWDDLISRCYMDCRLIYSPFISGKKHSTMRSTVEFYLNEWNLIWYFLKTKNTYISCWHYEKSYFCLFFDTHSSRTITFSNLILFRLQRTLFLVSIAKYCLCCSLLESSHLEAQHSSCLVERK